MKRIKTLPPAFKRFWKMGGVVDFVVFEETGAAEEEVLSAMADAFGFDPETLRELGCRPIREPRFFGDWIDFESGKLLKRGSYTLTDGRELENPRLVDLGKVRIASSASGLPQAGGGGQFAFAFLCPPYGLRGRPKEIQQVFDEIRTFILPPGERSEIFDWSSPRLAEVSDYFQLGLQWWGVFLFSIYTPALRRLTLIAASTSD